LRRDDGSTSLVVVALVAVVATLSVAVAALGTVYAARARAQTAADAGALAAAVATFPPAGPGDPVAVSGRVVADNGATLIACECPRSGGLAVRVVTVVAAVEVVVPVFGEVTVRGSSRAEFDPRRWLGR
jgi:secretion/DNA translocation related TadE-like protein